jgi:hypothetical protein
MWPVTLDGILAEHLSHMHTLRDINLAVYAAAKKNVKAVVQAATRQHNWRSVHGNGQQDDH